MSSHCVGISGNENGSLDPKFIYYYWESPNSNMNSKSNDPFFQHLFLLCPMIHIPLVIQNLIPVSTHLDRVLLNVTSWYFRSKAIHGTHNQWHRDAGDWLSPKGAVGLGGEKSPWHKGKKSPIIFKVGGCEDKPRALWPLIFESDLWASFSISHGSPPYPILLPSTVYEQIQHMTSEVLQTLDISELKCSRCRELLIKN